MDNQQFLLFSLRGPMAAFGEIAVGQRRSLWDAPSKSGVFGFLAACLGIKREENARLLALENSFGFAVRVENYGKALRDFHTAMAPTEAARSRRIKAGLPLNTRKDDLDCDDLTTMLSDRYYRLEAQYSIALWQKVNGEFDLNSLLNAIKSPVFAPYLGRKSCPLGFPPNPLLVDGDGLNNAFQNYDAKCFEQESLLTKEVRFLRHQTSENQDIWFEIDAAINVGNEKYQIRERRDALRNRSLWQFSDRQEGKIKFSPKIEGVSE